MSTMVYQAPRASNKVQLVDAYEEPREVPLWEQAGISLWLLVTYIELPGAGPMRYLLLAGILAYAAAHYQDVVKLAFKAWPILLLPIFGMFSFLWADYPSAAMRGGLLLFLTVLIPIIFVAHVNLRILLRCYFFAATFTVLWSLQWWGAFASGGPYGSKNYFAIHMAFAAFFFIVRAFDRKEHTPIRLLALALLPLSLFMVYQANSATSTIMSFGGVLGLILVRLVWLNLATIQHMKSILILLLISFLAFCSLIVLSLPSDKLVADFLAMFGKDATLTGRTTMWAVGETVAEERPIFGVGIASFWQDAVGAAQTINENDHKPIGTVLTFHNSYLETQVHLGYIGLSFFIASVGWVIFQVVRQWLGPASVETSAILVITVITLATSFTESWLRTPLNGTTMLFYMGALAAISSQKRRYLGRVEARTTSTS